MTRMTVNTVVLAVMLLTCSQNGFAATDERRSDQVVYRQLARDIQRIDRQYAKVLETAKAEARNSGKQNLELEAELLGLRDRRDRSMDRLMLLALRHGWEIPDFTPDASPSRASGKEAIFAGSRTIIREEMKREADEIASELWLGVITLPAEG